MGLGLDRPQRLGPFEAIRFQRRAGGLVMQAPFGGNRAHLPVPGEIQMADPSALLGVIIAHPQAGNALTKPAASGCRQRRLRDRLLQSEIARVIPAYRTSAV